LFSRCGRKGAVSQRAARANAERAARGGKRKETEVPSVWHREGPEGGMPERRPRRPPREGSRKALMEKVKQREARAGTECPPKVNVQTGKKFARRKGAPRKKEKQEIFSTKKRTPVYSEAERQGDGKGRATARGKKSRAEAAVK